VSNIGSEGTAPEGKPQKESQCLSTRTETLLMSALDKIGQSKIDDALIDLNDLININPKYRLAQLIYADLMMAKSQRITNFGSFHEESRELINAFREETLARWNYSKTPIDKNLIPSSLIQLADVQRSCDRCRSITSSHVFIRKQKWRTCLCQ
jgi:hypothetical protein